MPPQRISTTARTMDPGEEMPSARHHRDCYLVDDNGQWTASGQMPHRTKPPSTLMGYGDQLWFATVSTAFKPWAECG